VQLALEREPSSLSGRSLYGQLLAMDGETARAVKELEKALLLSPFTPERWVLECVMALAYFAGEAYEDAAKWGEISAKSSRAGAMAHSVLASSYYYLGERDKAKSAHVRFMQLAPTFSNARFRPMLASTRPDIASRYLEGLRGAAAS
jgi:tetratricopeptide (TPR) repeat protein